MFQFRFIYAKFVSFYERQTSECIFEILVSRKALVKIPGVTESKPILKRTLFLSICRFVERNDNLQYGESVTEF